MKSAKIFFRWRRFQSLDGESQIKTPSGLGGRPDGVGEALAPAGWGMGREGRRQSVPADQPGSETLSVTWITPFDWNTSA